MITESSQIQSLSVISAITLDAGFCCDTMHRHAHTMHNILSRVNAILLPSIFIFLSVPTSCNIQLNVKVKLKTQFLLNNKNTRIVYQKQPCSNYVNHYYNMSKQNMILSCKDGDAPTYKALLYMPSPIGHSYSSQLAVDISDVNNPSAIQDSTGYLIWPENTNKQHWFDVMDNMLKLPISNVENGVTILVCNAYTGLNFGHNLSTL